MCVRIEVVGVAVTIEPQQRPNRIRSLSDFRLDSLLGGVAQERTKEVTVYVLC